MLRNALLLLVLLTFTLAPGFGQLSLEGRAGTAISTRTFSSDVAAPAIESGWIVGPAVGFAARLTAQSLTAGIETQLAWRGYADRTPINSDLVDFRTTYLDLSPQIEYRPVPFLGILAGSWVGVELAESYREVGYPWEPYTFLEDGRTRPLDLGVLAGLRFHWNNFFFSASYRQGLLAVEKLTATDANGEPIGEVKVRQQSIQLGIGYQLPVGGDDEE